MIMKKALFIFAAFAALLLTALVSSSCDKHAYSISDNHFAYMDGSRVKEIGQNHSIKKGSSLEVFSVYSDDTRITAEGGYYTASSDDTGIVRVNVLEDGSGILLEGVSKGSTKVSLNFYLHGFHLYKTVKVTVK